MKLKKKQLQILMNIVCILNYRFHNIDLLSQTQLITVTLAPSQTQAQLI